MLLKLIFTWFFLLFEIGLLEIFYFILFKKKNPFIFGLIACRVLVLPPGIKPSPTHWKAES